MDDWFEAGDYTLMATWRACIQNDIHGGYFDELTIDKIHNLDKMTAKHLSANQLEKLMDEFPEIDIKAWWS
jgi:hypothetical protein